MNNDRSFMSCPLEELVRLVAYIFYEGECTMVLIGLLDFGCPVLAEELSGRLKLRLKDLARALGHLRTDGLITVEQREDLPATEDPKSLSPAQHKKYLKDYYSLDFKSFVDSVHLRIHMIRRALSEQCGGEGNQFYECPKCKEIDGGHGQHRQKYIFSLSELVAVGGEDLLTCPACQAVVEELDDSDEMNRSKNIFKVFEAITEPLLNLIRQTEGLVMIDDPDERCKPDEMMPLQEYEDEVERIRQENERQRVIRRESWSSVERTATRQGTAMDVVVVGKPEDSVPGRKLDPALALLLVKEGPRKLEEEADRAMIVIGGRTYTAAEIDQSVLDSIDDDDEFDVVSEFVRHHA
jgi:transcription initiation factor IIE alpha subunit